MPKNTAIITIVAIVLIAFVGALAYQQLTPAKEPGMIKTEPKVFAPDFPEIDTSNWKTYRNEIYSFRYPPSWFVVRENWQTLTTAISNINYDYRSYETSLQPSQAYIIIFPSAGDVAENYARTVDQRGERVIREEYQLINGRIVYQVITEAKDTPVSSRLQISNAFIEVDPRNPAFIDWLRLEFYLNDPNAAEYQEIFMGVISTFEEY